MFNGQPLAVFQPFIDTATGRIAGVEALARLRAFQAQVTPDPDYRQKTQTPTPDTLQNTETPDPHTQDNILMPDPSAQRTTQTPDPDTRHRTRCTCVMQCVVWLFARCDEASVKPRAETRDGASTTCDAIGR